ncbi:hypothetical protein [Segnochrobactrum spirostomi]|uniref:Uncharacterized protein n=1 Tax=Segnochrobactrum spirostomi TaxID=2608987 RepID=A0A6A7Y3G9_9HYPH|nr:hypothetical protein [Segnochrobactrum spirostomi]MQT13633.1 hypothetical protein [Segnochrobactrum spirostomi]
MIPTTGCYYRTTGARIGEITRWVTLPPWGVSLNAEPDEGFVVTPAMYQDAPVMVDVAGGSLVARPVLRGPDRTDIRADGEDAATIAGIPAGAVVTVDGAAVAVDDGTLEIVSTMPATYRVEIVCWPYQDLDVTIVAHEPPPPPPSPAEPEPEEAAP